MNTTVAEYPIEEWNKVINLKLKCSLSIVVKQVVPFMAKE